MTPDRMIQPSFRSPLVVSQKKKDRMRSNERQIGKRTPSVLSGEQILNSYNVDHRNMRSETRNLALQHR